MHVRFTLLMLLLAGAGKVSAAQQPPPPVPTPVEVGVWFNGIHSIDVLDGSFGAEFYLWWISPDPDFHPFETLQVLNGRQWTSRAVSRRQLDDGNYHYSGNVSVTVNHDWDLYYYPFDRQKLSIVIETPFTASEIRLIPNRRASVISEFVDVAGFDVVGFELAEHLENYQTDFGFRDSRGREFSRLTIELDLQRDRGRIVIAMLIGFLVANLIALLTYAIHVSMLGIRATMVASAIFGAVGNMYFLNSQVHPAAGSLLIDLFAVGSFTAILIALLNGIVVDRLFMWGRADVARRLNRSVFGVVLVASAVFYALAFHAATGGAS
jgi:hypothetical protein